jgi:hypothetical protein
MRWGGDMGPTSHHFSYAVGDGVNAFIALLIIVGRDLRGPPKIFAAVLH